MYYLVTQEWWDGDLQPQRINSYGSKEDLIADLKSFDYNGGCWHSVVIKRDFSTILSWSQEKYSEEGINNLKICIEIFIKSLTL